jgi:hypothetical protein
MAMINLARAEEPLGDPIMTAMTNWLFMSPLLNQQGLRAVSTGTEIWTATGTY